MVDKQQLVSIALKQIQNAVQFRQPRIDVIKKIEDNYYNKITAVFDARINIPVPFMAGQIDTVRAKIDNRPVLEFTPGEEGDIPIAKKVSESFRIDSSSNAAGWARKDRQEKFLALISGRGIAKIYAMTEKGRYYPKYEVIDYMDFLCEGTQGHLEDNLFCGVQNVFRSKAQIEEGVKDGVYDAKQVQTLFAATGTEDYKRNRDVHQNKVNRLKALGLSPDVYSYVGQDIFNLTEWCMEIDGVRWYLLLEESSGVAIRCEKLLDVYPVGDNYPRGCWPYASWAVFDEPFQFWTKGYGDDVLPLAEGFKIIINEVLNNTMRQNRPMRSVDPGTFPDPNELIWRMPDQLVVANTGTDPSKGIYTFETPNVSASLNVLQYINQFVGEKTGVNSGIQGANETDAKVGIYYGSLKEAEDRIGLVEKNYNESYAEKGYRYYWSLRNNITEKKLIALIGKNGVNWEVLTRKELKGASDFDVIITGGKAEAEASMVKQKEMSAALQELTGNPKTLEKLSPRWIIEHRLQIAGFEPDDIRRALEAEGSFDEDLMAEASAAIEQILEGTMPRLNRGANAAFLEKIYSFDADELDYIKLDKMGVPNGIDQKKKNQSEMLRRYADAHYDIVIQNTLRSARTQSLLEQKKAITSGMSMPGLKPPTETQQNELAVSDLPPSQKLGNDMMNPLGTPEGTAEMSQDMSAQLTP